MLKFNLYTLIEYIKKISLKHPIVNTFFIDRYAIIGNASDIKFPCVTLLQRQHTISSTFNTFNFTLLYADRLTEDRDNSIEIQSTGIDVLNEILNYLSYELNISQPFIVNTFNNQYADLCSGAVVDVSIAVPNVIGECEWFDKPDCSNC